ncbi:hypothetical protein EW145_g4740 [Phellinidium pouzarii]|uniref:Uncharacterized protein n=1 Tax=Phellinidium pouzarii TaxID=167371 RepID=A0A4S4L3U1_9AGAM|nr:hypothetical protein EW145_g4740 [Phellinidium pouzarii]
MPPPVLRPRERTHPPPGVKSDTGADPGPFSTPQADGSRSKLHHHYSDHAPTAHTRMSRSQRTVPLSHGFSRSTQVVPAAHSFGDSDEYMTESAPAPGLGSRATRRVLAAVRRSSSYNNRKSGQDTSERGMFSTPEERSVSPGPARSSQPPSIEQIAMGLHMSRTPHLGRTGVHATLTESSSATRVAPPLRSSLKKAGAGTSVSSSQNFSRSTSPSASASSAPSAPRSALGRFSLAFASTGLSRLDKFLGRNPRSTSMSVSSLNSTNGSDGELVIPRKAVRFVSVAGNEPDRQIVTIASKDS